MAWRVIGKRSDGSGRARLDIDHREKGGWVVSPRIALTHKHAHTHIHRQLLSMTVLVFVRAHKHELIPLAANLCWEVNFRWEAPLRLHHSATNALRWMIWQCMRKTAGSVWHPHDEPRTIGPFAWQTKLISFQWELWSISKSEPTCAAHTLQQLKRKVD